MKKHIFTSLRNKTICMIFFVAVTLPFGSSSGAAEKSRGISLEFPHREENSIENVQKGASVVNQIPNLLFTIISAGNTTH